MAIATGQFPLFVHVEPTKEHIPFVELGEIDLSKYVEGPEGLAARKDLATELEEAVRTQGFFFVTNHGFPAEKIDNLLALSQAILDLPQDVKEQYLAGSLRSDDDDFADKKKLGGERGAGFKPRKYWAMQRGVRDNIEHFNWRDLLHPSLMHQHNYPPIVHEHLEEVAEYYRYLHFVVLKRLCTLFDIILELSTGSTWKLLDVVENEPDKSGGGFGRAMLYHGMSPEDEEKTEGTWLRGHSDGSAVTMITSQPMASLQFRDYHDGQWKFVGYKPNALVVNIGDLLEFLTGSYFKSTIHRVVRPPSDQRGHRRLVYFCDTKPEVYVDPETLRSPKLERLGYARQPNWEKITTRQWAEFKGKSFGKSIVNGNEGDEPKAFYIAGRLAERWHQKV